MLAFPTPPTVMPSVADGTGASAVQVPCAYPDGVAVKVASAPAAMARSHFRRVQERSNMFPSSSWHSSNAIRGNASLPMRGRTGGKPLAPGGSTQELFAAVGSVFLSVAAARQGFAPFAWAAFPRREPRQRRRPSPPVLPIAALAAQDARHLSAPQVRA